MKACYCMPKLYCESTIYGRCFRKKLIFCNVTKSPVFKEISRIVDMVFSILVQVVE